MKSGFVAIVGRPNVGKSTLLNCIVGQKLSIVSSKPQATRRRVVGILTEADTQMVFVDTPGLLDPAYELQRAMRAAALRALHEADVIVYVGDARDGAPDPLQVAAGLTAPPRAPVVVALNKVDLLTAAARRALTSIDACPVSATTGEGVADLTGRCAMLLPRGPFLHPPDEVSTQPLRFFAAELVRETAMDQLQDELPYSIACEVEEFREGTSPVYIRAILYVERDSQKRILVGAGGRRIKNISQTARVKVAALVGDAVYLELWVKVLANWRRDAAALTRFGYRDRENTDA